MGQTQGQGSVGAQLEERYFLQKVKLGQGSFGTVWRAVDRHTNDTVAIKQLDKASLPRRGVTRQDIEREIQMMKACVHINITMLHNTFEDDKSIYLALEYCDGGDFGDKVKERGMGAQEAEVAEWMRQMCSAIGAMHAKAICHRDIKPDNFMVQGASPGNLKLSDFGLAIYLPKGKLLQEKCGTPAFMAPEQHHLPKRSPGYSFPADMWAVGVSMYMMMFGGKHPFLNDKGGLDDTMLLSGELDFRDSTQKMGFFGLAALGGQSLRFSEEARSLCKRMVEPDPQRRISADDTSSNRWLQIGREASRAASPPDDKEGGRRSKTPPAVAPIDLDKTMAQQSEDRRSSTPRNSPPRRPNDRDKADDQSMGRRKSDPQQEEAARAANKDALDQAAKLKDENMALLSELEERRRREEEIMMKEKRIEMQQKIFNKQKTMDLEELEKQKERQKEEMSALAQQREELEKQKARQAQDALTKAVALSVGSSGGPATSSGPSRPSGNRSAPPDKTYMPDKGAPPVRGKLLNKGVKCRYESSSYGWMAAVIQSYNESDGTYNLDVRQHAALDKIAPVKEIKAQEAWPPGTWASYLSSTVDQWLHARVVSFNESDSTYNLDVRDHAEVDRIRARTDRPVERPEGDRGDMSDLRRTTTGAVPDRDNLQTEAPSAASRRSRGHLNDTAEDAEGYGRRSAEATSAGALASSSTSTRLVTRGDVCMIPEHGLVFIESGVGRDGCYVVKVNHGSKEQKIHVKAENMRAPKESKFAWAPGTKVSYLSTSMSKWIDAHVVKFNSSSGTYDLDVRPEATPDKVRPR